MHISEFGLYRLIVREDKGIWMTIVMAACLAGLLQGCIVVIINQAAGNLAHGGPNFRFFLLFCLTVITYSFANYYASTRATKVTEQIIFSIYVDIADKIRNSRTIAFESIGKSRIYTTLHSNTDIILESSKSLAGIGAAIVMIIFSGIYIAIMSRSAILTIIVFYIFGVFVYVTNFTRVRTLLNDANEQTENFKGWFSYFLEGFKEIKVDHNKSEDLFNNYIKPESKKAKNTRIKAENQLAANTVFIQSFYYIIIAAVLFLLPRIAQIDPLLVIKIAAVVLFSYGSMTRIVLAIPLILKSEKAIEKLDQLDKELTQSSETSGAFSGQFLSTPAENISIRAEDLVFHYPGNGNSSNFLLGPITLKIDPGQMVFIAGSNGSGKTTLLKLLSGLYQPDDGQIYFNNQSIGDHNYEGYRNLFSVIFSDYYIFNRFYGTKEIDNELVTQTLIRLGLDKRVHWMNEQFSDLKLSAGQMKRLALLCGYMDDSPILIMDEVAADLDPQFRQFFYETFLKELLSRGKTIVAVSHDDKYFHMADQLLRIEQGRIVPQ